MLCTLELRPKQPAERLLCLAVVTRHHHLFHDPRQQCFSNGARAWARIPHRASPLFAASQPLQPREGLPAAATCLTAYQGPASA
eukprot:249108-Chlamydomonas_euryale.AAC.2